MNFQTIIFNQMKNRLFLGRYKDWQQAEKKYYIRYFEK